MYQRKTYPIPGNRVVKRYIDEVIKFNCIDADTEKKLGKAIHEGDYVSLLVTAETCPVAEFYLEEVARTSNPLTRRMERDLKTGTLSLDERVAKVRGIIDNTFLVNQYQALVAAYFVDVVNEQLRNQPPNGEPPRLYYEPTWVLAWEWLQMQRKSEVFRKRSISEGKKVKERKNNSVLALPAAAREYLQENKEAEKALGYAYRRVCGEQKGAYDELICANLRLSISIAAQYQYTGHALADLIQQGNEGLMRAAMKFDYERGFKFSTYASWWIRQSIFRYNQMNYSSGVIRIPVHIQDAQRKIRKIGKELEKRERRKLSDEEIAAEYAAEFDLNPDAVLKVLRYNVLEKTASLDAPTSEDGNTLLKELYTSPSDVECPEAIPLDSIADIELRDVVEDILAKLTPKEEKVIRMRYGIGAPMAYSLEEIGNKFGLTRERIRQIEVNVFRQLKSLRYTQERKRLYEQTL